MTKDEIAALIPANVVEAAAKAKYEAMRARNVNYNWPTWEELKAPYRNELLADERASLAAGLAAWGGAWIEPQLDTHILILPIQEPTP